MGRHTFIGVLIFTLIALAVALLLPGRPVEKAQHLPWQITQLENGSIRVFGIEIENTPLGEIELLLGEPAVISLFDRYRPERAVVIPPAFLEHAR